MEWRPKGGKPLAVGCNAMLDHGLVAEAWRRGEWLRTTAVDRFIEADDAAALAGALVLAARGLMKAKSVSMGPP